jgi:cytochrome c-type biogenesis protein CcmH
MWDEPMHDRMKTLLPIAIGAIALGVIVVGLAGGPQPAPTPEQRVENLSAAIKCPFCNGESLAESPSSVAGDYRDLIALRVAAGATDAEILDEFAANFGDSYILDGSTTQWTVALWAIPVALLIGGIVAIATMRKTSASSGSGVS